MSLRGVTLPTGALCFEDPAHCASEFESEEGKGSSSRLGRVQVFLTPKRPTRLNSSLEALPRTKPELGE